MLWTASEDQKWIPKKRFRNAEKKRKKFRPAVLIVLQFNVNIWTGLLPPVKACQIELEKEIPRGLTSKRGEGESSSQQGPSFLLV